MAHSRRKFIKKSALATGGLGLLGSGVLSCSTGTTTMGGHILGPSLNYGHLLRQAMQQKVSRTQKLDVVVVGGGVSGLSAARTLKRAGITQFKLLELEGTCGGNARTSQVNGQNCPWGAHYMPLPTNETPELLQFLEQCGAINGWDENKNPEFADEYLTFAPAERLYRSGYWQNGLVPEWGLPSADKEEINHFLAITSALKWQKGMDQKYAFAFPVSESSQDQEFRQLDLLSMETWLLNQGFKSEYIFWYVNYCCRDDFGSNLKNTSAWAGLHYFCSRRYQGKQEGVLTWPQGNAWLTEHLRTYVQEQICTGVLVFKVGLQPNGVQILYLDVTTNEVVKLEADYCILAIPQFVVAHLLPNRLTIATAFTYTPWLVANIGLKHEPLSNGRALSWDNVIYDSPSLGYVHANHQELEILHKPPIITYYEPLSESPPLQARQWLLKADYNTLSNHVLTNLEAAHAGVRDIATECSVWRWGHGMVSPYPGFIWGQMRKKAAETIGNRIFLAHTDIGGVSVFEEAFYQGLRAAENIIKFSAI